MKRTWKKSSLKKGESLVVPFDLFVEPEKVKKRLLSVVYVGETQYGILVDCFFEPSVGCKNPSSCHYRKFINWASIYCGNVKVKRIDGASISAKRA